MGFADTLAELAYVKPVPRCTVGQWLKTLPESDVAEFEDAIKSDVHSVAIHRAMRVLGFEKSSGTLLRHRRKECTCELR